jgi:pseudouridine-5'-phosphate glycosidase
MSHLEISEEVQKALKENRPIVALESTIISHGMPYPKNVETALRVEAEVRKHGAIPATIAVINGKMKAGLSKEEIELLGKTGTAVTKVSRRDLPIVLARKMLGATTVATTMIIAEAAGIQIFATGGIGGVHRGAGESMDISADLQELARTNVAVVSAGVKSILDLGLTLEYLETHGVPVLGFQTDELPAFYTRKSGFSVDYQVDTPEEIAQIIKIKKATNLNGGMIIANPVPEKYQMDKAIIDIAIEKALKEADEQGIKGKEITPFLLARIEQITSGNSLESNIQLVLNNAKLGAEIARCCAQI